MKRNITDQELKEFLRVGDPDKTSILNREGGSLYLDYYVTNIEDLPYNTVLCCYVWEIGDIEDYLYEEYVCRDDNCILKDDAVMKRAVQLIHEGFKPKEDN